MKNFILIFIISLIHGCGCTGLAQTVGKQLEFNSCWGTDCESNLVKNPSAAKNDLFKTTSNATATQDTSLGKKVDGKASWLIDTSANGGYTEFELIPTPDDLTSGNCMAKLIYNGDGSLYSLQILDGSNNVLNSRVLQNIGSNWSVPVIVNAACAASGARKVRVAQTTAGTSPAINVAKVHYGIATNIGAGVPNNVFSAKSAAVGTVTDEGGGDWITGNCTKSGGASQFHDCNFSASAGFTIAPNCVVTPFDATTSLSSKVRAVSATAITIESTVTSTGAGANTAINLTCTKAGTDFIQPAITAQNWNYEPRAYTPTLGAGFGTGGTSPTNVSFFQYREGKWLYVFGSFTTGTTTAALGSISLPSGLIIDTTLIPINNTSANPGNIFGDYGTSQSVTGGAGVGKIITAPASSTSLVYLGNFSQSTFTQNIPSQSVSTTVAANSIVISVNFKVPIAGWTENQNAPQLLGSVTSNATSALRTESVRAICSGSSSIVDQTTPGAFSAISNVSGGACNITIATGVFSARPWCQMTIDTGGSPISGFFASSTTTTNVSPGCVVTTTGTSCTLFTPVITCTGPR